MKRKLSANQRLHRAEINIAPNNIGTIEGYKDIARQGMSYARRSQANMGLAIQLEGLLLNNEPVYGLVEELNAGKDA